MIRFEVDQAGIEQRLTQLGPRVCIEVAQALGPLVYASLNSILPKYFSGSAGKGTSSPGVLTTRSGDLFRSVIESLQTTVDGTNIRVSIGSDLPYAAIQEYGGFAGRRGPFKKKRGHRPFIPPRPYLRPAISELEQILPDLVEQAIEQVTAQQQ